MTSDKAQQIAEGLLARYNLHGWQVWMEDNWTDLRGRKLFGQCLMHMRVIVLCSSQLADESETLDTILHEIAHALADTNGGFDEPTHGPVFRDYFTRVCRDYKRCPLYLPTTGINNRPTRAGKCNINALESRL